MKTLNYQKLTTYGNPGGEGSTALPTSFLILSLRGAFIGTKQSPVVEGIASFKDVTQSLATT